MSGDIDDDYDEIDEVVRERLRKALREHAPTLREHEIERAAEGILKELKDLVDDFDPDTLGSCFIPTGF